MNNKKITATTSVIKELNNAWLDLNISDRYIINPLDRLQTDDPDEFYKRLTCLFMNPNYFSFMCKQVLNIELLPMQALILKEMWNRKFPMLVGSRGLGKTFLLSLYCILRAILIPNRKIVVVGAAFRQSKYLHEYMENIWKNAPILRDMCDSDSGPRRDVDMCKLTLNGSTVSALPIGDGQKIRGQRANDIIADEFASMSREIFENVIAGFAAVSANPVEAVKQLAYEKKAKELGVDLSTLIGNDDIGDTKSNQIVLSGTAYYDFNHFSEYWKRWKTIIETKGDTKAISNNVFNGEDVPASFNWKDYSIIRIPVDLVPAGFMDEGQIARSKATVHNGIYLMEFGAVFTKDSQGFFKRSLIESCVGTDIKPVKTANTEIYFDPLLKGHKNSKYVMAIDPASEVDNFSIVILEVYPDHRRLVYCWTTTRKDHTERVKKGLTKENNFYTYCAR
jgi:hypothetical protein